MSEETLRFHTEDSRVGTRFIPVPQPGKWTFETEPIMEWVRHHAEGRILNACAGETPLTWAESVVSNDINPERKAHLHVDVAELPIHLERESFDTVIFDPPWTLYQANLRYDGHRLRDPANEDHEIDAEALPIEVPDQEQVGHARLAKEGFDYLLKPGGVIIELSYSGSCMPARLNYVREERVVFDPPGELRSVIGSVDRKLQQSLTRWD